MSAERWISLNKLADETGMAVRTLQYIRAQEPSVLTTRQKGSALEYKQPDCAVSLRAREREAGAKEERKKWVEKQGGEGEGDPFRRKAFADARKSELDVEERERSLVPVDEARAAFAARLTVLRNILVPFPRTAAPKLLGAKTIQEIEQRLEVEMRRTMEALAVPQALEGDSDVGRAA